MAEPATTSAAAIFSATKIWSILASVCGSVIPVMALSEKHRVSLKNSLFMAATGSSFAIFVGPWVADYLSLKSPEAIAGLSWTMGAIGVYLIRAIIRWLDLKGIYAVDRLFSKVTGTQPIDEGDYDERIVIERKTRKDSAED